MIAEGISAGRAKAPGTGGSGGTANPYVPQPIGNDQFQVTLANGRVVTGSFVDVQSALQQYMAGTATSGGLPLVSDGAAAVDTSGEFVSGSAVLRYQEGSNGKLYQDVYRNMVFGLDGANVFADWTDHFGADPTFSQLVGEVDASPDYGLALGQYAALSAAVSGSSALSSLGQQLIDRYAPVTVTAGGASFHGWPQALGGGAAGGMFRMTRGTPIWINSRELNFSLRPPAGSYIPPA